MSGWAIVIGLGVIVKSLAKGELRGICAIMLPPMRLSLKIVLAAILAGALLVLARGLRIAGYEPVTSDNYLWGAFHAHSSFSDGLAPLDAIAAEAREARVGLVLMSDHGPPHREATLVSKTIDGVRFVGGSEVGLPEGHLIVSDVDVLPKYNLPPFPPDAVADIAEWGGLSIVTYPEDPTHRWLYWEDDFTPNGIEIINVTSYFRASSLWAKLDWALMSLFNPYYYVSSFTSPAYALERWDELLTRGPVWGFYAANAHGGFPVTQERFVAVPSYATAFSYVGLGIDRKFAAEPELAIRRGDFFSIVRGAGEPERFELVLESSESLRVVVMAPGLTPRVVLKRGGAVVAETNESELVFDASSSGVYRAEVYLDDHPLLARDVPWISSNPIFVNVSTAAAESPAAELVCSAVETIDLSELRIEMDDESTASLDHDASGALTLTYALSQATEEKVDRWVALARRQSVDLSEYRGFHVAGAASESMRYWIELRAEERGYYATFKVDPSSTGTTIPWRHFYPTVGEHEPFAPAEIDAMFVAVNTSSSRTGFASALTLTELGWCR
jgi:hypothetical protein